MDARLGGEVVRREDAILGGGVAEAGRPEAEVQHVRHVGPAVVREVKARHAQVDDAVAHVRRDVAGAQKDELDPVVGIVHGQLAAAAATVVAGLVGQVHGPIREGAFVGEGDL